MPVRSSVCAYNPSSVANSKYSTVLPASSPIGHYKPLSSLASSYVTGNSCGYSSTTEPSSRVAYGSSNRYGLSSSSSTYSPHSSPSSGSSSSYSSLGSNSSTATTTSGYASSSGSTLSSSSASGYYRPLGSSTHNSFSSARYGSILTPKSSTSGYNRYSSGSLSSTSSSSLGDREHLASSGATYSSPITSSHRYTSSLDYKPSSFRRTSGYGHHQMGNSRIITKPPLTPAPSQTSPSSNDDYDDDHDDEQTIYDYWPPSASSCTEQLQHASSQSSPSAASSSLEHEQLPSGVPRGLVNLGNTCYINASIQSLYSIESFRNLVLRAGYDKQLSSELSDLFRSMKSSREPISPANFKYAFSKYQQKFSGLGQQDAQEFLRYLINGIHEESNKATRRPKRSTPPEAPKSAQEAWSLYRDIVDDSPFVDLLVGQMCSTIVCCNCQNKSDCWDPFWDLSLPLVRGRHSCKLSEVLQDFIAKETLESDERPICSKCKRATRSTKQIHLCRLPPLIILHLKKFTNDGYKMSSPEIRIDRILNLDNGTSYQLQACISHHGHSSSSGHYTSHCKYSSRWFHFNDDRVRDVTSSFDSSKLNDAYVLFYTQSAGSLDQSKL